MRHQILIALVSERPWYKSWPDYIPRELEFVEKSIPEQLMEKASEKGSKVALVDDTGRKTTYEELDSGSSLLADSLSRAGVGKGDTVAFMAVNSIESIEALYGVMKTGAKTVMIDPTTMSEDLKFLLNDSNPKAIIIDEDILNREKTVIEEADIQHKIVIGHNYNEFKKKGGDRKFIADIAPRKDAALIFYYAGIVGRTEQVIHSHYGIHACALSSSIMKQMDDKTISLPAAPISHVLGLMTVLSTHVVGGAVAVMSRFNAEKTVNMISNFGITHVVAAPYAYNQLLEFKPGRVGLKLCVSGGAPLSPETQARFRMEYGAPLVQEYGMTESLLVSFQTPNLADKTGTVGLPMVGVDAKIVDEQGVEVEPGSVGELLVKSPWVMMGYADEEDTSKAIRDGWLYTGDLMSMDENGLLYFRGVKKRMIKYKAYPIFPRDLELILLKHPAVKEARVEGKEDKEVGQKPVAYVKLREDAREKPTAEELMEFVNKQVAAYKKIRELYIVE